MKLGKIEWREKNHLIEILGSFDQGCVLYFLLYNNLQENPE